jgi:hypothetical protein
VRDSHPEGQGNEWHPSPQFNRPAPSCWRARKADRLRTMRLSRSKLEIGAPSTAPPLTSLVPSGGLHAVSREPADRARAAGKPDALPQELVELIGGMAATVGFVAVAFSVGPAAGSTLPAALCSLGPGASSTLLAALSGGLYLEH